MCQIDSSRTIRTAIKKGAEIEVPLRLPRLVNQDAFEVRTTKAKRHLVVVLDELADRYHWDDLGPPVEAGLVPEDEWTQFAARLASPRPSLAAAVKELAQRYG